MFRKMCKGKAEKENRLKIPLVAKLLMIIGLLTVLYFIIVYLIMPALAIITKAVGK